MIDIFGMLTNNTFFTKKKQKVRSVLHSRCIHEQFACDFILHNFGTVTVRIIELIEFERR